ncbi:MAG TPA: ATP-binding protein [Polyangiaceae bacterium]|nr:ATP-binding protein [Polyangiaceae bacterium]
MTSENELGGVPPMPGVWHFGWLLFMQPLRLRRMLKGWGFEDDPSLRKLMPRWKAADPNTRQLVRRLFLWLCLIMPSVAFFLLVLLQVFGFSVAWKNAALNVVQIFASSVIICATFGVVGGVAFGVALGIVIGIASGIGWRSGTFEMIVATSVFVFVGTASLAAGVVPVPGIRNMAKFVLPGVVGSVAIGIGKIAYGSSVADAVKYWVQSLAFLAALLAAWCRLPVFLLESLVTVSLAILVRVFPERGDRMVVLLPYLYHDLIYFPLPGLRHFLVRLMEQNPIAAVKASIEALSSFAQMLPAAHVIYEFRARDLEQAAVQRLFSRAAELDFPYLRPLNELASDSPYRIFQAAARDLGAGGNDHRQRRLALDRAEKALHSILSLPIPSNKSRRYELERLHQTARLWLEVLRDDGRKLAREEAEHPQVPSVFVAGPALTLDRPDARSLFKGRSDLVDLISHDLSPGRRGVLLLFGQRRMGKTSLRNWLPTFLGTGTTVVSVDFQALSGHSQRHLPHRVVLDALTLQLPDLGPPPDSPHWGDALAWLRQVDESLGERRVLIVIDEVERVEDGIRDGWCQTDFLDFLRAAGDALGRIRVLLLTAYPLIRLGPHWADRLVSVTTRSISYLDESAARELICCPVPDFPNIYPDGGVERILGDTRGHPFLIQKLCDELCRLLNQRGGRGRATHWDIDKAVDRVLVDADLFDELWRQRTEAEKELLRRLARTPEAAAPDPVQRQLLRDGYLEKNGDCVQIVVPLFRTWIVDNQGTL